MQVKSSLLQVQGGMSYDRVYGQPTHLVLYSKYLDALMIIASRE
jgi:hypothetical protein